MKTNKSKSNIKKFTSRGFVTIATGNERYYRMAANLLHSYKVNGESDLPFAIVCDKDCAISREFDDVVIIDNPNYSYMDKLSLYKYAPYEETIFIDADSLVLAPLNILWEDFAQMDDFCCYGKVLPLNSNKGWFFYEGMQELKEKLTFGINMHGGIYFLRKSEVCKKVFDDAIYYAHNYNSYAFAKFNNPADEPVLALAMSLAGCKPYDRNDRVLFLPSIDSKIHLQNNGSLKLGDKCCIPPVLHFANINIKRYIYKYMVICIQKKYDGVNEFPNRLERFKLRIDTLVPEVKALIRRVGKRCLPTKVKKLIKKVISK